MIKTPHVTVFSIILLETPKKPKEPIYIISTKYEICMMMMMMMMMHLA